VRWPHAYVPFYAAARVATVVVLARHSVLDRRCEIADLAHADIRRRYQSVRSLAAALCAGNAHPVTSLLAKVAGTRNFGDSQDTVPHHREPKVTRNCNGGIAEC